MRTPVIAVALLLAAIAAFTAGCEGPTGPKGPPGDGAAALADPAILPKVVYTHPAGGGEGPYDEFYVRECSGPYGSCNDNPVIRLRFNKYMEAGSLRAATTLSSDDGGVALGSDGIQPLGGDLWLVHPSDRNGNRLIGFMKVGRRVTLRVDSAARDVNGNRLAAPYTLAFTPEPHFRIVGHTPADGAGLSGVTASVSLSFNSPIDSSILGALRVTPAPSQPPSWQLWSWQNQVSAYLYLDGSTRYTVTVDSAAADKEGHRLPAPFSFSFSSTPFKVTSVWPEDGRRDVWPRSTISMSFSEAVDTSTFRNAFHPTPPFEYWIGWYGGSTISIGPWSGFQGDTKYTITIDTTLRSLGGARLAAGFSSSFTTGPPPPFGVESTIPSDGQTESFAFSSIYVRMNRELDTSTVRGAFGLEPDRPGRVRFYGDRSAFTFIPDRQLPMGTSFAVTLDTTLRAADGTRLREPYRFSFGIRPLALYSILPVDGRPDVPPAYPLRVTFTGKLDSASVAGALRIDPPIDGTLRLDDRGFTFLPADVWTGGTIYRVTVDTTLQAEGGGRLESPVATSFTAAPFSVIQHIPPDGATVVPVNMPVWIYCNDGVDTSSAKAAFSMTDPAGAVVPGWFGFSPTISDQFGFRPNDTLRPGSWYDVAIGTAFRSARGHAIESPVHFRFRTAD